MPDAVQKAESGHLLERVAASGSRSLWWLTVALAGFLRVPSFVVRLVNSDEASLATMAMVINHGGRLYHETADRKPPIGPYVYAGVFRLLGSFDIRPVRVLAVAVLLATALLLASEARRRAGSDVVGVAAGLLFIIGYHAWFANDSQAASFALFMLLPMTASVVLAARDRPLAAGFALALACLCKQTALTTALPVLYLVWQHRGLRGMRSLLVGFAVPIGVGAVYFGPGPFLLWTVTGNGGYLEGGGSVASVLVRALGVSAALLGLQLVTVVLCGVALYRRAASLDLWLWLFSAAVAVTAGFRFFGHYYYQLLPAAVLIAAPVLVSLARGWRNLALGLLTTTAVVCSTIGFIPTGDARAIPYEEIADRVNAETRRDDRIFIWGDVPEIYWSSGRAPATRFIHTGFLTGNSGGRPEGIGGATNGVPGAWDMLSEDFERRLPDLILDVSTSTIRHQQYYPMSRTLIWPIVERHYRPIGSVDGVRLYRLTTPR
jgi:hypothetical protein